MASLLIIAMCMYADSFRFISDSPYEGEWKAAAVCALALALEFAALLWPVRGYRPLAGRRLLVLVAVTGLRATGLAIFAGWHATQGLPYFGAPSPPGLYPSPGLYLPTPEEVHLADAAYQTLSIVDTLAVLVCLATAALVLLGVVMGPVFLATQDAVRPSRER